MPGPSYHRRIERHLAGRAVLIADDFLEVDVIDALVLARVAAEGKAFLHLADEQAEGLAQVAGIIAIENGRFRRRIIRIFARFGTDFDDFPRFNDEHTLTVVDSNARTIGNDIVFAIRIAASAMAAGLLPTFGHQDIFIQAVTVKTLSTGRPGRRRQLRQLL